MNKTKRKRLSAEGWKVGTAAEFLNLSPEEAAYEEAAYIDLKVMLSRRFQQMRQKKQLTQQQAARLLKSSQSRVAKMEAGDPSVSLDLLVRSLLVLGAPKQEIARMLGG